MQHYDWQLKILKPDLNLGLEKCNAMTSGVSKPAGSLCVIWTDVHILQCLEIRIIPGPKNISMGP